MIQIDVRDRRPIYEQIVERVIELIGCGALKPGERLPPVRQLAAELSINPNTIQKAYSELEKRKITNTTPGRGSFVTENYDMVKEQKVNELELRLAPIVREAKLFHVALDTIVGWCRTEYEKAGESI